MAEDGATNGGLEKPQRISISLETLRQEIQAGVENGLLKLQLELFKTYATKEETVQLAGDLRRIADAAEKRFEQAEKAIDDLEVDKAGRDAVMNFKRWLTGGAVLATIFMAIQVAISLWLVTRGHGIGR